MPLASFDAALRYFHSGLTVIPLRTDGSKAACHGYTDVWHGRKPLTEEQVREWFAQSKGIGVLTGIGGLTALDVDDGPLVEKLLAKVPADVLKRICRHKSPREGGGMHLIYRRTEEVWSKSVLAWRKSTAAELKKSSKTIYRARIETTNYVCAPGSAPGTNAAGDYKHVGGPELTRLGELSEKEHGLLIGLCRSFDQKPAASHDKASVKPRKRSKLDRTVGDDFMRRGTWDEVLVDGFGMKLAKEDKDGTRYWMRPGKDSGGHAATTDGPLHSSIEGNPVMNVFSSSMDPFEAIGDGKSGTYNILAAYVLIGWGDFSADSWKKAIKALHAAGYGPVRIGERGLAELVAEGLGGDLLWVSDWEDWLAWDGQRYELTKNVHESVLTVTRRIRRGDDEYHTELATAVEDSKGMAGLLKMLPGVGEVRVGSKALNRHPLLLNVGNGTIDLETGELREASREDFLTQCSEVEFDPNARCSMFEAFIDQVLQGDEDLAAFVQRLVGYALTGLTDEHKLPILAGEGGNGKGCLVNVLNALLGDYCGTANASLITQQRHQGHPTEMAKLFGKRLVTVAEGATGGKLDEERVKRLTGGDRISARRMREDFWEFEPTHKIWLLTNNKPRLESTDRAMGRRLLIVPFDYKVPVELMGSNHEAKLRQELPGVMNWALRGLRDFWISGLDPPSVVISQTAQYFKDNDKVAIWIDEHCDVEEGVKTEARVLFSSFETHAPGISVQAFGRKLTQMGFESLKSGSTAFRVGLRLKPNSVGF